MKPETQREGQRGQALPLFTIMLIALIAATGLVIDVGGAWAQERSQQKASDVAALAGATKEANGGTRQEIIDAATASAIANGYAAGEVQVNIPPTTGKYAPGPGKDAMLANDCSTPALYPCWVEVKITRSHSNYFAGVIGQGNWNVGARGVAVGGIANSVLNGIAPLMFDVKAVQDAANPTQKKRYCDPQDNKCNPNNDFPLLADQFNYTTFCVKGGKCNVSSNDAVDIIEGGGLQFTVTLGMDLGAHNQGQHTAVCKALLDAYPNGSDLTVAINDDNGNLYGFWTWHFDAAGTDCNGKDGELVSGWFINDITATYTYPLTIVPGAPAATFGQYVVQLVE